MKDLTQEGKKTGPSLYLRFLRFVEKVTKKKFLIKLGIFLVIFSVIFFPETVGNLIGTWFKKLTQAFIDAKN